MFQSGGDDLAVGRGRRGRRSRSTSAASAGRRCPSRSMPASHLGAVAPAVDGRASAVEVRGTVSWVTHRDGPVPRPGRRDRRCAGGCPSCVNSGGDVAWVTDASGDDAIELWDAADRRRRRTVVDGAARSGARAGRRTGRLAARRRQPRRTPVGRDRRHRRAARDRSHRPTATSPAWTFSPDSRWLAWSHPGPPAARPDPRRRGRRPGGRADRRHAAALRRHRAGIQHRRQVPGVPVDAQLRPDLRRLRVRPVVPQRLAGRSSSPSPRRPRRRSIPTSPDGRRPRRRTPAPPSSAPPTSPSTPTGSTSGSSRSPCRRPATRRCAPSAVASRGCGRRSPARSATTCKRLDDDPPRPALERFDLTSRRTETLRRRRRPIRADRRRQPPRRRRQARVAGRPRRSQGGAGGGGEVRRRRHRRPRPACASSVDAGRRVAADVRRSRAG